MATINHMSKRKKPEDDVPPAQAPKKQRKQRKHLTLPPRLHQLLSELAEENFRPITYELQIAVVNHLKAAGKEVPPLFGKE